MNKSMILAILLAGMARPAFAEPPEPIQPPATIRIIIKDNANASPQAGHDGGVLVCRARYVLVINNGRVKSVETAGYHCTDKSGQSADAGGR